MSNEFVGFENLPNAFIKEIDLFDYSPKEMQIKVTICVHERKDSPLWYSTESILTNLLRIGVVFSTDEELNTQINEGDTSPFSTRYMQKPIPMPMVKEDKIIFDVSFSKVLPKDTSFLNVYSFCFIDKKQLEENYGFTLSEIYYGPVKSEKVIQNSNVVGNTNAFLRPNGDFWPGPVHSHSGRFMIGSYHTTMPHESLTKITLPNTKIKDFRKTMKKQNQTKQPARNFISDLMVSYNSDTDINALFMMNMKSVLKNNTKFGAFLERASESVVRSLVDNLKINLMTIQRQRVKIHSHNTKSEQVQTIFSSKNIVKTGDEGGILKSTTRLERNKSFDVVVDELRSNTRRVERRMGEIFTEELGDYKKISMIKELFFDYGRDIRAFQLNDYELTDTTPGFYQYKMDLQFTDPVYPFLVETIGSFKGIVSEAKKYVNFASRGRATLDQAGLVETLVNTYVANYSYIYEISTKDKNDLTSQMFGLLNPATVTLQSAKQFRKKLEELYAEFLSFVDFDPTRSYSNKQRVSIMSKNQTTGRILITKNFKKIIQPSSNLVGFNYMNQKTSPGMKVMSKRALQEQSVAQTNDNYAEAPAIDSPDLDEETNTGLNDTSTNSTTYWSPKGFKVKNQKSSMGSDTKALYGSLNGAFQMMQTQKNNGKQQGVTVQEPSVPEQTQTEENTSQFIESSEIIGENQEFVSYSGVADSYNVAAAATVGNEKFNDYYSGFQNDRTFTAVLENAKKLSGNEAQQLPNQLKAVIHGQSTATKTDYASSGLDLLANPKTKNYYEVNNFSVQKMIYIDGFMADSRENILLNKPVYKEMSLQNFQMVSKPVVCFLEAYTNDKFKITDENKVSVVDSFFILSDRDITVRPENTATEDLPTYNMQDVSYEFMNSSTVVQTNSPMVEQIGMPTTTETVGITTTAGPAGARTSPTPGAY